MPSNLALSLCLIFCFVVLHREGKLQKDASWSWWLPTLWMMFCASRSLSVWFNPGVSHDLDSGMEGIIHDQIFLGALMLSGWVVLWQRQGHLPEILRSNFFLFIFFGYMGLSVFWSEDMASFKRWIKALGDLTMALIVTTEPKPWQAILAVIRRTSYLLVPLSVTLVRYFHHLGTIPSKEWGPDMWIGVATHKNTLAQLCLFAGIVLFWDAVMAWRENRQVLRLPFLRVRVDVLYGVMLVYLLYGGGHSKSTTSFLVLVFACGLFLLLERQRWRGRHIVPVRFVCGLLLTGLVAHLGMELAFDSSLYVAVAESQGKDATLTGRTELWEDLLIMGQRHSLLGAGYGGFWTRTNSAKLKQRYFWGPQQAHNGYIEIWLQLGVVGLLLFALVVWQALQGVGPLSRQDFEYGRFRLILLLITLLHNYSEAGFPRPTHLVWFVFLLVVINVKPVPTISAEKVPAPAGAAWQFWKQKDVKCQTRTVCKKSADYV
jgi:exopolysaccharide production protein ExoQ